MSFYVRRSPSQCDPRSSVMGHEELNGIQTPPARLYFEDRGPATPTSQWTYEGPLGMPTALPEVVVDFTTPSCEPRFVVWEKEFQVDFPGGPHPFHIRVEKRGAITPPLNPWDQYFVELMIDFVPSLVALPFEQLFESDYSKYQAVTPGEPWKWGDLLVPTQTVSWTQFQPCAWDRVLPGPPFVPGAPP